MKDTNRRKFLGRLVPVAALSFLVPWALVAREAQAGKKAKTKEKKKKKSGE